MKIEQVWQDLQTEKVIGKGSYGTVYKCFRENNGEKTYSAVKVISIPQTGEEYYGYNTEGMTIEQTREYYKDIVDDFANEIKILESLKGNKNIVEIRNYKVIEKTEEIGWEIFIEMELLTDFNTYASDKTFTEEEVLKLGTDLCNALYVCNEKNIIHRDIKPENIFVSENGEFKLGDFGVSRQLEKTDASMSRKGTFNYMAPEVFYSKKYDSRADVYSLGLVMYKLLNNNRMPFLDSEKQIIKYTERQAAFDKRINGEKIPPINGISDELNEVILKACEYKTEDRYNNAEEFKKALEKKKLTGASGWVYRYRNILRIAVVLLVVVSVSASIAMAVKFGKENDKNIIESVKDSVTELLFADFMVSGKAYTSEPVKGLYVYTNKNGVFTFNEETEKSVQIYDKASSGPVYDGEEICFISENKTAIYRTKTDAETPEKIFSNTELELAGVVYFDDECVIATCSETNQENTTYYLVFVDIASSTYEKIADLGDDIYAVYADGNIVYLNNSFKGASGCEIYAYNIGDRESILLASDAYADEDFAEYADNKLSYISKENDEAELKIAVCNLDGSGKEYITDEIKDCKEVIYIDENKIFFTSNKDSSNIYDVKEKSTTSIKDFIDEVYTYDGKYYAFEKFDDGYRLNEVCADGSIKASMYTDNIKNKFDVITLKKDKFLSWNNDSATFDSVKTNEIDPLLVAPTEADWKKFEEEELRRMIVGLNFENFDCENVDSKTFFFDYILNETGQGYLYSEFFDEETLFWYDEVPDPKKRFKYGMGSDIETIDEYNGAYSKLSVEKVGWIAKNIFNVDYDEITDLKTKKGQYNYYSELDPYVDDGYYYSLIGDGGDGWGADWISIDKTYHADGKVSLKVDMNSWYYEDSEDSKEIITITIQVGLKCIDNKNYWSVYTLQTDASISDLERLEHLENEATEKDVVYPNDSEDYFEFIKNSNNEVIGVRTYLIGDYTNSLYDGFSTDYSSVCASINVSYIENEQDYIWKEDNYVFYTTWAEKSIKTYDHDPSYVFSDNSDPLTSEESNYDHEIKIQTWSGYSTAEFYFDQAYSVDEAEQIFVQVELPEGCFYNNDEDFHSYSFSETKYTYE